MPTNPISIDTERMNILLLKREKRTLGQAATSRGYRSTSEFIRHLISEGLKIEDPQLAKRYDAARLHRYAQGLTLCFIGSLVIWQVLLGNIDARRAPRQVRVQRKEQVQ